ncbi:hypothetical protein AVEN_214467-1 [Araneus ventricosus]|uniref:Uncharacterized protein n=1 Tax=Araneus ventricosus TaxID=182803 RepID=A0A4Y2CW12_ARAVE|nr:hypothetical protein AVEN_214467-1 [Araneus ventricosus]
MASKGTDTRDATADAETYIMRCGLEKAISQPVVVITGQDVDLVVLLIALAPPESNIYFMKSGKRKVVAKLFSTKKAPKRTFSSPNHPPSLCIQWLRNNISYL